MAIHSIAGWPMHRKVHTWKYTYHIYKGVILIVEVNTIFVVRKNLKEKRTRIQSLLMFQLGPWPRWRKRERGRRDRERKRKQEKERRKKEKERERRKREKERTEKPLRAVEKTQMAGRRDKDRTI